MCSHKGCWSDYISKDCAVRHNRLDHSSYCSANCDECLANKAALKCSFCKTRYARRPRTTNKEICTHCLVRYGLRVAGTDISVIDTL